MLISRAHWCPVMTSSGDKGGVVCLNCLYVPSPAAISVGGLCGAAMLYVGGLFCSRVSSNGQLFCPGGRIRPCQRRLDPLHGTGGSLFHS